MALSQDTIRARRGSGQQETVAIATGQTVVVGSLVIRSNASGRIRAGGAVAAHRVEGVVERLDSDANGKGAGTGVGNTSGTEKALIRYLDEHEMTIATAIRTNASLGLNVFISDDDTVAGTAVGTSAVRIPAGELVAFSADDKSKGWVAVRRFAPTNIAV